MNQTISPADDDPRQRRALARFAAVQMVLQARQRGLPLYRALQEAAQQPWDGRFYAADTIEEWVYRFEHGNFPALYDQRRRDQGTHRALDPAATEALLNLRRQYPDLTLPALTAELLRLGILQPGTFSASTLQRRLVAAGLDRRSLKAGCLASGPTKAFELPLPNLLWMADGMHGPGLKQSEGSTLRTFLFALTQAAQASPATGRCRSIARSSTPQAAGNCRPRNPRAACLTHSRQQFSFWPCQPRRSVTRESGFVPGMPLGLRASDFFYLSAGLILPHQVFVGPVDRPLVIQGRALCPEDVALIRDWLQAHPDSNRTRLSRDLCVAWNWCNGAGRLKDMACRTLLLKLEACGQIRLPPRVTGSVNGLRNRAVPHLEHDQTTLTGSLDLLQPVQVQPVATGSSEALLLQFLLQRYHYLGHRNCVGQNLKYLARDRQGRPLACLLFGSAAWKAAARDRWIGWGAPQRQRHLGWVSNNARFIILPWVRVPHLASHLLGRVAARLSADWQQKYGHPIYLLETFVERPRFTGACYRAAGWIEVGLTTGRTRNDDSHRPRAARKAIFLKPLDPEARRRLAA